MNIGEQITWTGGLLLEQTDLNNAILLTQVNNTIQKSILWGKV